MAMERTLIIAKPDAVQRGLVGEIVKRLETKGLKMVGLKMMQLDSAMLQAHYAHIADKPFFADVESFMKSSPVVVMAWEGYKCVDAVRIIMGPTNSREAAAGTIRGDLAMGYGHNLIHGSDSKENGEEEVSRFFEDEELFSYDKTEYMHVYEEDERKGK